MRRLLENSVVRVTSIFEHMNLDLFCLKYGRQEETFHVIFLKC